MLWRVRHWIESRNRSRTLIRAISRLGQLRHASEMDHELLRDLVFGWGNEAWSAEPEYLQAIWSASSRSPGPILECGSGLSTLVAGVAARNIGQTVHCLEHTQQWATFVQGYLAELALTNVVVHDAPLREYAQFAWYSIPTGLPGVFGTVICDGPPSSTLGGRYGLMPCMSNRIDADTTVLLDDVGRVDERLIADRWASEFDCSVSTMGTAARPYSVVRRRSVSVSGQ